MLEEITPHDPEKIHQALAWITALLNRHQIPYQAVGGLAAQAYGAARPLVDIDLYIPMEQAGAALEEMQPYIVRQPLPHHSAAWNLVYLALEYAEILIEIGDTSTHPQFYNNLDQCWEEQDIDYGASVQANLYGVEVSVMPLEELLRYKARLNRPVDQIDIQQIQAAGRAQAQ